MSAEGHSSASPHVLIVGGGVAGLEAMMALRDLAGDRLALTLVSQDERFVDRPMTPAEPFGLAAVGTHQLPEIAAEFDARFVRSEVAAVAADAHRIRCADGRELDYDTLILAPGARMRSPFPGAITFGTPGSGSGLRDLLGRVRSGEGGTLAFVAPSATGWLLPLYELALMTAREFAASDVGGVVLRLITPEERPLALFGEGASDSVAGLLTAAGIEFTGGSACRVEDSQVVIGASDSVAVDRVVTLPLLGGPELGGVPASQAGGFIPVDEHGRVEGLADVYAAGDATDFPIKQGGLAAQQADAVAEHVASRHAAGLQPAPFRPVLRGTLLTGGQPRFLRTDLSSADPGAAGTWYPLWWPPTKVAGRYLPPYLFGAGEEGGLVQPTEGFLEVDIPLTSATLPG
jgi:sulfide:quinone oxidoreductase